MAISINWDGSVLRTQKISATEAHRILAARPAGGLRNGKMTSTCWDGMVSAQRVAQKAYEAHRAAVTARKAELSRDVRIARETRAREDRAWRRQVHGF